MPVMKTKLTLLAVASAVLFATPTVAMPLTEQGQAVAAKADEISAAKRKRYVRHAYVAPPRHVYRGFADPSFDQYGRPYRPPSYISCPIDLGYGRWASCNTGR
jgi:hypothetical protein